MRLKNDVLQYVIGGLILLILLWKAVNWIFPDHKANMNAQQLLTAVIAKHDINNNWQHKKELLFDKDFKLFSEDGIAEIDRFESHRYKYDQDWSKEMQWQANNDQFKIIQNNKGIVQYINDSLDVMAKESILLSKINAASFVIELPFSLNTQEASKKYLGIDTFQDQKAHALEVSFKNSMDVWTLYFTTTDFNWLGYWVKTSDHYSLVINEEMEEVEGITLSRKRKSYRTDSLQNKLYLRASYVYSNYTLDYN